METNYGFIIEKTSRKIKQSLQKRFNDLQIDITVDQWVILLELSHQNGLAQYEIAEKTNKDAPTVNRIIELLLQKELVIKSGNSEDKRKSIICLSKKGMELVANLQPEVIKFRREGWENLNEKDLSDLKRIMQTIYNNFT